MSSIQYVKGHAVSLGLVFVFLAGSSFVAWNSMRKLAAEKIKLLALSKRKPYQTGDGVRVATEDKTWAELKLTGVKLDAVKKGMTGEAEISLTPNEFADESKPGFSISPEQLHKSLE